MTATAEKLAMATDYNAIEITHETLQQAFNSVANLDDWRAPIDAVVDSEQLPIVILAIRYFTSTAVSVTPTQIREPKDAYLIQYRVRSVGYRMGPAGP